MIDMKDLMQSAVYKFTIFEQIKLQTYFEISVEERRDSISFGVTSFLH